MPRGPRIWSESGYMHIYTRGNGKQILFEQREDYLFYLHLLKRYSSETKVTVCAFCLMENHTHMLVCDREQNISLMMEKIGTTYSGYFNRKYERTGHLFDGRYKSIPIESEDYMLTVFRYILNNPQKANICTAAEYPWSSYDRYGFSNSFVDTSVFQDLLGSREEYEAYIAAKYEDYPELEGGIRDDEWAKKVIRENLHIESGTALQSYDMKSRNEALALLKRKGLSLRQIERLTGIPRRTIKNA